MVGARLGHAREVAISVALAIGAIDKGEKMDSSHHVGLKKNIIIPVVLTIHLQNCSSLTRPKLLLI